MFYAHDSVRAYRYGENRNAPPQKDSSAMLERFVIVPAVPVESGTGTHDRGRYFIKTLSVGFNIYDNHEKLRLTALYACREAADVECGGLNRQWLQLD